MGISAFSGQNKVTQMCPKISFDPLLYMIVSVSNTDKKKGLANSNNIHVNQAYTVYANTNMAGTRIVCPIYTVNLYSAQSEFVA